MSAVAELALDVRGFLAGIDLAKQSINNFRSEAKAADDGEGFGKLKVAAVGLAAGIVALGVSVQKGVSATVEMGAKFVDISYKSGLAVKEIMALQRAFEEVGGKAEDVAPATKTFNEGLEKAAKNTGPLVGILKDAGLSIESLASMSVADRMQAVAQAIAGIQHPTQQAEAAVAAFGASGAKMVAALQPGSLTSAADALGSQAQIMQANAGVFARIMQLMGASGSTLNSLAIAVRGKLQGLFAGIAGGVGPEILKIMEASKSGGASLAQTIRQFSPALEPLAKLIESLVALDLANVGMQIGAGAAAIAEAVMNGDAIEFLKAGLTVAAAGFREELAAVAGGLSGAFATLVDGVDFSGIISGLSSSLAAVAGVLVDGIDFATILKSLETGMVGIGRLFIGLLQEGIGFILTELRNSSRIFKTLIPEDFAKGMTAKGAANVAGGKADVTSGAKALADSAKAAGEQLIANIGNVAGKFQPLKDSAKAAGEQLLANAPKVAGAFTKGAEAARAAAAEDTTIARDTMADIVEMARQNAATTAEEMRGKFATPAAQVQELAPKVDAKPVGSIVSSLAKIGGDMSGPQTSLLDINRAQLAAQQEVAKNTAIMADKLRAGGASSSMPSIVYQ